MELVQILFLIPDVHAGVIADAPPLLSYFVRVLQFLLSIVTAVAVIAIIVSGVMYMTASGDVGRATSAKTYLLWSITGLCIALLSFAVVRVSVSVIG